MHKRLAGIGLLLWGGWLGGADALAADPVPAGPIAPPDPLPPVPPPPVPPPPAPPPPPPAPPPPTGPRLADELVVEADRYVTAPGGGISTATRTSAVDWMVPRATSTVTAKDIFEQGSRTVPIALEREPGVFVQQTNLGAGSPIVRGLTGEQVLLLMDGIRLNNATTRSGPNQYTTLIDPFSIDRIEVLRGPGSVLYGSDALGGVINVIPKRRSLFTQGLDAGATLAGNMSTANDGGTGSARTSGSAHGIGWEAGVNYHDFQALKIGDAAGLQVPTAYAGFAGDVRLFVAPARGQVLSLGYQGYEDRDVPRTDAVESGRNLRFDFDPQRRQLLDLDWRGAQGCGVLESWRVNVNLQRWDEGRVEVRPNRPAVERELYDRVDTWGAFAQATLRPLPCHRLTGGAELYHDWVYSRRNDVNTATGVTTIAQARYPTDSTWMPFGVFLQDEWTPTRRLTVVAGVRYSLFELHTATRTDSVPVIPEKDSSFDQVTGSLAASYEVLSGHRVYASVSQGFRAPNVDDTTVFDRAASGIEVPNADLTPEQELAYELGWKAEQRCWHGGASVFLSDFTDLIQRVPGTFEGSPTIDGLPVSTRENVAEATMKGFEVWGEAFLGRGWSAFASASYVHGDNDETGEPLNKIPPLNGTFGAKWRRGDDRLSVEPFIRWAGRQTRLSQADKDDFRIGPGGTPGWWTANLRLGYTVDDRFEWTVEAGNLLDERYKHHGSGVEDPGRYLTFGVEINL